MAIQMDTSGVVKIPTAKAGISHHYLWSDLSPFTQGYVEALFAEVFTFARNTINREPIGFRHLAPESLARIMEDCAWMQSLSATQFDAGCGLDFWASRQKGETLLAILTPYLGDDGLIYLRELA